MSNSLLTLFTLLPLAVYFFVLGFWHTSRHPRVIPGQVDYWLLIFGVSGLIVFGPPGHFLVDQFFPGPSLWAWLSVPAFFMLLALLWAPRAGRRLVIYNVAPALLSKKLREVVATLPLSLRETATGYEVVQGDGVLRVEAGERSRIGLIEARGVHAEALLRDIAEGLRQRLRSESARPASAAPFWYLLAVIVLLGPVVGVVLSRPQVQAALRVLRDHIRK